MGHERDDPDAGAARVPVRLDARLVRAEHEHSERLESKTRGIRTPSNRVCDSSCCSSGRGGGGGGGGEHEVSNARAGSARVLARLAPQNTWNGSSR
jgi:hypothetical protein